tara:strand:- start:956 stop:1417 length:462 start_codon:yes stop_codon:yes gene_type:complete
MLNRIKPFASIRSDDEAMKLMSGAYDENMGTQLARQMLAAKANTNLAEITGEARTDAADKLASGAFFNSLIGGVGALAGAGIKSYNANQASNIYANSDYDYPMYEDPAITGGNETWSYWDTDMGVNESPIYRQVQSQPTVDSILGGRLNTSWF